MCRIFVEYLFSNAVTFACLIACELRIDNDWETMKKSRFSLDPLPEEQFDGYTDGRRWNGWACPYFNKAQADRLVHAWTKHGYQAEYDPQANTYKFGPLDVLEDVATVQLDDPEQAEHYSAVLIAETSYYPIGAGAWIWDEVEEEF